jgi:hypothetical protein
MLIFINGKQNAVMNTFYMNIKNNKIPVSCFNKCSPLKIEVTKHPDVSSIMPTDICFFLFINSIRGQAVVRV